MSLPTRFVARPAPARLLVMAALALGFVVGGAWIAGLFGAAPRPGREWIGWGAMLFFGLCAVMLAWRSFDRGEQIIVDGSGLYWKQWSSDVIPWTEITEIREADIRRQRFLCIYLRDPERYPSKSMLSRMIRKSNAAMDFGDMPISPIGTDRSFDELKAAIFAYWNPRTALYARG